MSVADTMQTEQPQDADRNDPELLDLAEQINTLHAEACELAKNALERARRAGLLLIAAKAKVKHGEWYAWRQFNVKIPERTAQAYMKIAREWRTLEVKSATVADLGVKNALEILAAENKGAVEDPTAADLTRQDFGFDFCAEVEFLRTFLSKQLSRWPDWALPRFIDRLEFITGWLAAELEDRGVETGHKPPAMRIQLDPPEIIKQCMGLDPAALADMLDYLQKKLKYAPQTFALKVKVAHDSAELETEV